MVSSLYFLGELAITSADPFSQKLNAFSERMRRAQRARPCAVGGKPRSTLHSFVLVSSVTKCRVVSKEKSVPKCSSGF